jgi:hypothetical protein
MARPKGGTLTALFEVSAKERQEFWDRQERIRRLSEESSPPPSDVLPSLAVGAEASAKAASSMGAILGTPEIGIPDSGAPTPDAATTEPHLPGTLTAGIPESGVPDSGIPDYNAAPVNASSSSIYKSGTPRTGIPDSGIPRQDIAQTDPVFGGVSKPRTPHTGIPDSGTPNRNVTQIDTSLSGIPEFDAAKSGAPFSRPIPIVRIRQAVQAQDGHSLGEQAVYRALWDSAKTYEEDCRIITIGYRTLSSFCGLTVNNCKTNLQGLQRKLSIKMVSAFSPTQGTTYLIYSYGTILQRRREAGLTHYIKSRGVTFVNPDSGIPLSGTPKLELGIPEKGIPEIKRGVPVSDKSGVPFSGTHSKNTEGTPTSSSSVIAETFLQLSGEQPDDDAVSRIRKACQSTWPEITDAEIAVLIERKLRTRPAVKSSLVGFLAAALPKMRLE